jgi:hypothetical protein
VLRGNDHRRANGVQTGATDDRPGRRAIMGLSTTTPRGKTEPDGSA